MSSPLQFQLTQRLFRYLAIWLFGYLAIISQSDARVNTLPSTPGQKEMAQSLADELKALGLEEIVIDEYATVMVVMTLLENLTPQDPVGDIVVAFVADEEIGLCGAKALDLARFDVDFAWTLDCCEIGEVVYENFNAAEMPPRRKSPLPASPVTQCPPKECWSNRC